MKVCRNCGTKMAKYGMRREKQRYKCSKCGSEAVPINTDGEILTKYEKDTAEISSNDTSTIAELLKKCEVDLNVWEVAKAFINKSSGITGKNIKRNYQIKVWLKKRTDIVNHEQFKKELKEDLQKYSPIVKAYNYPKVKAKHLLEVNIFDLHFGKLGWGEETGGNYDTKIARKRFMSAIVGLSERANVFGVDRIVFPVGNDFFHSDNAFPFPQTTKGTPQQEDLRWQKSFREGRKLIIEGANYLSKIAPVDIVVVAGNHDLQKSFYLGDVLEMAYQDNQNVTVNNKASLRKYYQYHNNLIGYTHGNSQNEGEKRLISLMPQEVPQLWAKTKFREWHLGDVHHKRKIQLKSEEDFQGIMLRYMRSLCGDDAWHAQKGYRGAIKGAEAYLHHKEYGLVANFNYNIVV